MTKRYGALLNPTPKPATTQESAAGSDQDRTILFEPEDQLRVTQAASTLLPALSADRSSLQSPGESTHQSTGRSIGSPIVSRPKAFYITQRLDRRLDEAVRYFQQTHGIKKADRSTIVNAILDDEATWSEETLDRLVGRVIGQLTNRLTD